MTSGRFRTRRFLFWLLPLVFLLGVLVVVDHYLFVVPPLPEPAKVRRANALDRQFVIGANLPWINYGQDFGTSGWGHRGISDPTKLAVVDQHFRNLSAAGVTVVRWFVLADGRSGLKLNDLGEIAGLDEYVMVDLQAAVDVARKYNMQLILVLLDFHFLKPKQVVDGVQVAGKRYLLDTPALQDAFIEKVFVPIFKQFGRDEAIAAWEVINEPDWVVSTWRVRPGKQSLPLATMQDFIRKSAAAIHEHTLHYATLGSATRRHLQFWENLGLDLVQFHFYPHVEKRRIKYDHPAAKACPGARCIVGEFPTANGGMSVEQYISIARRQGYGGAFFWSYDSNDKYSDRRAALEGIRRFRAKPRP